MQPNDLPLSDEENQQHLSEDGATPAAPAPTGNTPDDQRPGLSADDPRRDSGLDMTEAYDAGMDATAELPTDGGVTAYNPNIKNDE